jgi:hypothetical protein
VIRPDNNYELETDQTSTTSPFDSEIGETHFKIITVDTYTPEVGVGYFRYVFDYFWCNNIVVTTIDGSGLTCNYYNISSSNTEIVPIINYNNSYTIQPPRQYFDTSIVFTSTSLCMECNGALAVNDDSVTDSAGNTCTSAYDGNAALCGTLDVVARWRMDVTIPTDELRNASAGNQIEFYIYAAYNNDAANSTS